MARATGIETKLPSPMKSAGYVIRWMMSERLFPSAKSSGTRNPTTAPKPETEVKPSVPSVKELEVVSVGVAGQAYRLK